MKSTWYFKTALYLYIEAQKNGLKTNFIISPPIKEIQSVLYDVNTNTVNPESLVLQLNEGDFSVIMTALSYMAKIYEHIEKKYSLTDDQYSDLMNDACFLNCLIPSLTEKYYPQGINNTSFFNTEIPVDIVKQSAERLLKDY